MTPFKDRLINYTPIASRPITTTDKRVFHAIGKGDMRVRIPNGSTTTTILLKDVLYAPAMGVTIISISRVTAAGANFCRIFDPKHKRIGHVHVTSNGLYRVDHGEAVMSAGAKMKLTLSELHQRMGHITLDAVRKLVEDKRVVGVELEDDGEEMGTCESCEFAKTTRKRVRKEREEPLAKKFGDEIHSDVWGPATTETIHHRKYYSSFTNDSTHWSHVKLLHGKDDTFDAYIEFEAWADTQHSTKIKCLRSDRGGKYLSTEFSNHLKSKGTERRLTTHDTPEHNGVAESLNRRLLERVRAMLHHSGLPKFLWGEAILHAVWLKNRTSTCALKNLTPFEALTGMKPNLSNLPEWGTKVWVHDDGNSKLEGRSKIGRWVGFDADSTHAHRIYWPGKRTVSVERNIKFDKTEVYIPSLDTPLEGENDSDSDDQESVKRLVETSPERSEPVNTPTLATSTPVSTSTPIPDPIPHRSHRIGVAYKDSFPNYAVLGEIEQP